MTVFSLISSRRAINLFAQPLADERQHLALAIGELRGARLAPVGEQLARDLRVERRLAAGGRSDPLDELLRGGVLEQVAERAGIDRPEHLLAIGGGGEDHDPRLRASRDHPPGGLDPVHLRHRQVEQHDVGLDLGDGGDRGGAVADRCDDVDVGLGAEQLDQAGADDRMILREQQPDHRKATIEPPRSRDRARSRSGSRPRPRLRGPGAGRCRCGRSRRPAVAGSNPAAVVGDGQADRALPDARGRPRRGRRRRASERVSHRFAGRPGSRAPHARRRGRCPARPRARSRSRAPPAARACPRARPRGPPAGGSEGRSRRAGCAASARSRGSARRRSAALAAESGSPSTLRAPTSSERATPVRSCTAPSWRSPAIRRRSRSEASTARSSRPEPLAVGAADPPRQRRCQRQLDELEHEQRDDQRRQEREPEVTPARGDVAVLRYRSRTRSG